MNLPNKLTVMRIFLVPIFVIFMYLDFHYSRLLATLIFIFASFTDFLDGYIARKNNLVTNFGKFADPLADKILVCSAMICLVALNEIPAWAVIIIISREFAVTGLRILGAADNITIAASKFGKIKTITQLIALIIILYPVNHTYYIIGLIIFYISLVFTILSGIEYFNNNKKLFEVKDI